MTATRGLPPWQELGAGEGGVSALSAGRKAANRPALAENRESSVAWAAVRGLERWHWSCHKFCHVTVHLGSALPNSWSGDGRLDSH